MNTVKWSATHRKIVHDDDSEYHHPHELTPTQG